MRRLIRILAMGVALVFLALPAMGDALDDAKAAGKLGEGPDGFLHAVNVSNPGPDDEALAKSINAKRRVKYQSIASKQDVPLDAVSAQAGKKLIDRTPAGQFVLDAAGKWIKK